MKKEDVQINLNKRKTLLTLASLAVLIPTTIFGIKEAKERNIPSRIADWFEYDCFHNNPYLFLAHAKETGETFDYERRIVGEELLKAKEQNPNLSYIQLLAKIENQIAQKYGNDCIGCKTSHSDKCPESRPYFQPRTGTDEHRLHPQTKFYMITHMELYHLLKMTPEKDQKLMILGYMMRKDPSIMDYSTETEYVNYPEMKKQSKILVSQAISQYEQMVRQNMQKSRD
ncbi:MAG: hypothetical protein E7013_03635 [Alphaproteobacteria bacterium]|nr:hypothetical protein [Alphaproteobacteria bacterium]